MKKNKKKKVAISRPTQPSPPPAPVVTAITETPISRVYTVERKTTALALVRTLGNWMGIAIFGLLPLLLLLLYLSKPHTEGALPSGLLGAVIGFGQIALICVVGIVCLVGGMVYAFAVPQLYGLFCPRSIREIRPEIGPEGIDLGPFGRYAWSQIEIRYRYSTAMANYGVGILPAEEAPLLIQATYGSAEEEELVHRIQTHQPPAQLPYIGTDGRIYDSNGRSLDDDHTADPVDPFLLLYRQSAPTILNYATQRRLILLFHSGRHQKPRQGASFTVGETALVPPTKRTRWLDLDHRVLLVRTIEYGPESDPATTIREYPLDELVLVVYETFEDEGPNSFDLAITRRRDVQRGRNREDPELWCAIHTARRRQWTEELANALAAQWGMRVVRV